MEPGAQAETDDGEIRAAIGSNPTWYHTIELAPGVLTPGWFDLRPIADRLPWPEVRGKRCLDVGTYDGFLAFEMERRGAAEVVATDIPSHSEWDWPLRQREIGGERLARIAGEQKGLGFEIAQRYLGSAVRREWLSVYDLTPERLGTFDVVVCSSLLLHLRDPIRALETIRSVCGGRLLSSEQIDLELTAMPASPGRPLQRRLQPTALVDRQLRRPSAAAGVGRIRGRAFLGPVREPLRPSPPRSPRNPKALRKALLRRAMTGGSGVPSVARLARPDR